MFLSSRQCLGKHVLHINHSCAGQQDYMGDLFYLCALPQFQYFLKDMLLNLDSFTYFSETGSHYEVGIISYDALLLSWYFLFLFTYILIIHFLSRLFIKKSYHLTCKIQMKSNHSRKTKKRFATRDLPCDMVVPKNHELTQGLSSTLPKDSIL